MIQTFGNKEIQIKIKTTMIKDGECYFGKKDIDGIIEECIRETDNLGISVGRTSANYILQLNLELRKRGIAPFAITTKNLTYTGIKMTDLSSQKEL